VSVFCGENNVNNPSGGRVQNNQQSGKVVQLISKCHSVFVGKKIWLDTFGEVEQKRKCVASGEHKCDNQ
jgi:hypothetical protein